MIVSKVVFLTFLYMPLLEQEQDLPEHVIVAAIDDLWDTDGRDDTKISKDLSKFRSYIEYLTAYLDEPTTNLLEPIPELDELTADLTELTAGLVDEPGPNEIIMLVILCRYYHARFRLPQVSETTLMQDWVMNAYYILDCAVMRSIEAIDPSPSTRTRLPLWPR